MGKLNIKALALTFGVLWGGAAFILGLSSLFFNWGTEWVDILGKVYFGYEGTLVGSIVGGIWAFVDGFIGGGIFGWLYNRFVK